MKGGQYWLPLAVIATVLLSGCAQVTDLFGGSGAAGQPARSGAAGGRAITVSAQPAREGPIALVLAYSGSVQPVSQMSVVPRNSGRITKLAVDVGSEVKAGDLLASIDRTSLDAAYKQAEANVTVAQVRLATIQAGSRPEDTAQSEAALASAQARLAQVRNGATAADLQAAESAVASAQSTVQKAQTDLLKLQQQPTPDDLRAAQLDLERAKNALWADQISRDGTCARSGFNCDSADARVAASETALAQAQRAYDKVAAGARPEDVAAAQKVVDSAQAGLQSAQAKLAQLKAGPTAEEVAIASASVAQAQAQLALKKAPYTERDVQTAQAQIAQAQATRDSAKAALAEADIVAPFDGIVTQKLAIEGAIASTQSALLTISSAAMEIPLTVEEARLGVIQIGQPASITVPAYPGQAIQGKVSSIAPSADAKTHTFVVKVTPGDASGRLRAGMFAQVSITTQEHPKAVLIPKGAIVDRSGKTLAFVIAQNRASMREIKMGLTSDQDAEILSGITAGELVATGGQMSLSDGDAVRLAGAAGQSTQTPGKTGGQQGQPGAQGTPGAGGKPQGAQTGQPAGAAPAPQK